MDRHLEKKRDRQAIGIFDIHIHRQTDRQQSADRHSEKKDRRAIGILDIHIHRQTGRQTCRQTSVSG